MNHLNKLFRGIFQGLGNSKAVTPQHFILFKNRNHFISTSICVIYLTTSLITINFYVMER